MENVLQYPNRRYGNPAAMRHYALWYGDVPTLARALRRSQRSVRDWLSGAAKVPWWVPEIMRLQQMEHNDTASQITGRQIGVRLGVVAAGVVIDAGARFLPGALDVSPARHQGAHVMLKRVDSPRGHVVQHVKLADAPIDPVQEHDRRNNEQLHVG